MNMELIQGRVLCQERLERLLNVLRAQGGEETLRRLEWNFGIHRWEVREACELGWITLETRKPKTGRPAKIAKTVSKTDQAKGPEHRFWFPKQISIRHLVFARESIKAHRHGWGCGKRLASRFGMGSFTDIYMRVYPSAKSRRGASASVSRLLRQPDVMAVRAWLMAQDRGHISRAEPMPQTREGITGRMDELLERRLALQMQ